jgi:FkbM family methyltransferase
VTDTTKVGRLRRRIAGALLGPSIRLVTRGEADKPWPLDAQPSYSQEGEDRLLCRLLAGREAGFYVDVGAHHPTRFSNTALLYEAGWRGINVDPAPGNRREFARVRPRDINLELGVGLQAGTRKYFVFDEPALNTFSPDRAADLQATTHYRLVDILNLEVVTLAHLLARYLPPGQPIDLLTIDTEGLDLDVLRSNDWRRFRPSLVIAEDLRLRSMRNLLGSQVVAFLDEQGYEPIAKTINSVFFAPVADEA